MHMESSKMVLMDLFAGQQWRHRHRKQTCGHSGEGEDGVDWENSTETYTLPYVKQIVSGICCVPEGAHLVSLWQPSGVGYGMVGGGREAQEGADICLLMTDSCCMAEANTVL